MLETNDFERPDFHREIIIEMASQKILEVRNNPEKVKRCFEIAHKEIFKVTTIQELKKLEEELKSI